MNNRILSVLFLAAAPLLFGGCSGTEKMDLEMKVVLDGKAVSGAAVKADGVDIGVTGSDGMLTKALEKKPGAEVQLAVAKDLPGHRIKPWTTAFVMKLPKKGSVDKYTFTADLEFMRFLTIAAFEKGAPVPDAVVRIGGKDAGSTAANGEFVHEYRDPSPVALDITVSKPGYAPWKRSLTAEPGQRIEAALAKRVLLTVAALVEEYGQSRGIAGLGVSVDRKTVGKTDAKGVVTWSYDGESGKKVPVVISAPGYLPEQWKATITLEGEISLQRYFTPMAARPIRTGIYRFTGNTPNADLKTVLGQTEEAVGAQLFKYGCFKEVPAQTLQADMKAARVSIDKAASKGWRETPLRRTVDMIVLGSVAKDEKGYLIETKFVSSGGKVVHSQIARAKSERDIPGAAKEIAAAVLARFPFEGTVVGMDGDRYRINLGKDAYRIAKHMEFTAMTPRVDETGKVTGYRETGRLVVKKADDASSSAEAEDLKKGEKVSVGDRVVRRVTRDEDEDGRNVLVLSVKGGLPPDVAPLAGVSVYLNEQWIGSTNAEGKAVVPVAPGKRYDLVLYRHGYQQFSDRLRVEKGGETKEFILTVNNALFRIESQPSGAEVFVDGDRIGRTPLTDGRPVTLGFHSVKVSLGGEYRDWEEVVEFASKTEDRTGNRAVVLFRDTLRIGERAEQRGDIDGAIAVYRGTEKGHPDYSVARHRLAQLYLDEKNDYDGAIGEFENVLTLPENQQLVYKQYAVAFTNLGHAYYEKGSSQVPSDRTAAAQNFAKAVQNLQKAKQNTRFFPTDKYDEAVHDTYYYAALSYHKLYLITKKASVLNDANTAWREYFDFFPKKLEGTSSFEQNRETAQKYWDQIKGQQ